MGIAAGGQAYALSGEPTATVEANPNIILADGRSQTTITVTLDTGNGQSPPDGTQVHFVTTSGTLSNDVGVATSGIARVTLVSSPIAGHATVTASYIASTGSASGSTVVEFTSDSALANTDQVMSNWIRISSNDYLAYCADFRTVDAAGKKHGVHIVYRGLNVQADAAQIDLDSDTIRAQNAVLTHGDSQPLMVDSLVYNLDNASGVGMQADAPGTHTVQQIQIDGYDLKTTVLKPGESQSAGNYDFRDLSAGHLLITAESISAQPHMQIQLARAAIYMDGKHIVSMPNQVMPIDTDQPFGKQIVGFGTDGFYLDLPYYSTLTPKVMGIFSLRTEPAAIAAGTDYAGRPPYALDYERSFNDGDRSSDLKFNGLSTPNWSLSLTQSQKIFGNTQAYFYFDSPEHQSLFSSADLTHDFRAAALNLDLSDTRPLVTGASSNSQNVTADLSTPSHIILGSIRHGLLYTADADYDFAQSHTVYSNTTLSSTVATHSFGLRMFTPPILPSKNLTITDSLSLNQTFQQFVPGSALEYTGNLQASAQVTKYSHTSFSFVYTHSPLLGAPQPIVNGNTLVGTYYQTNTESLNWSYDASAPSDLWSLNMGSTLGLPQNNLTLDSGLTYRLSSQMHLGFGSYYSEFLGYGYNDFDFSVSHRLGLRDVVVTWDALMHRWQVNLADAQF